MEFLPACPDPISGDGRATTYNGLTYAVSEGSTNKDAAMDVLKFFGSEEAMKIQGESGAAIPAFTGTEGAWIAGLQDQINVQVYADMMEYGHQSPNSESKPQWSAVIETNMLKIYNGEMTNEEAWKVIKQSMDELLTAETHK